MLATFSLEIQIHSSSFKQRASSRELNHCPQVEEGWSNGIQGELLEKPQSCPRLHKLEAAGPAPSRRACSMGKAFWWPGGFERCWLHHRCCAQEATAESENGYSISIELKRLSLSCFWTFYRQSHRFSTHCVIPSPSCLWAPCCSLCSRRRQAE